MNAAAGICMLMSTAHFGTTHLCLAKDFKLTTAIGLDEDGFPVRKVRSRKIPSVKVEHRNEL